MVISHACATAVNQQLYADVQRLTGADLTLVVPSNWQDEYGRTCTVERWPGLVGQMISLPVWRPGNIVLHTYRARLSRILRDVNPDVLYIAHEPYAAATAQVFWAVRRAGIRPVMGFYSAQNIAKRYPIPFRWTEAGILHAAAFAFPVSQDVERTLRGKGYAGIATVLPLGIDPAVYFRHPDAAAARSELLADTAAGADNAVLLGYVGRLVSEKGLATLFRASRELLDLDWRLALVGAGPMEPELRQLAAELGIADRVVFAGFVPHTQVARQLSAMDVMVLPSETQPNWREQFGRVILEAIACGTPVVGSDSGEIPLLINDTGGGLVFRERDSDHLAEVLRGIIVNAKVRHDLAVAGTAAVTARYTVAEVAKAFARAMDTALASRRQVAQGLVATAGGSQLAS